MSNTELKNFKGLKAKIEYEPIIEKYSRECCDILKSAGFSPVGERRTAKKYADGWSIKDTKNKQSFEKIVWNETNYQLTHLLENGHLIVNKRNGVGWASPQPHIERAYQQVREPFIRDMTKVDIELK